MNYSRCIGQHLGHSRGHTHTPLSRAHCRREAFQNMSPDRHLHRAHSDCLGDSSELKGGWEAEVSDDIGKVIYSVLRPGPVLFKCLKDPLSKSRMEVTITRESLMKLSTLILSGKRTTAREDIAV